jgi:hypothetical protein
MTSEKWVPGKVHAQTKSHAASGFDTRSAMTSRRAKFLVSAIALCLGLALVHTTPADAKSRKHKGRAAVGTHGQWGTNLVRPGPLYNGQDYLGTDPDPNIRFQILRDLSGRYGGGGD